MQQSLNGIILRQDTDNWRGPAHRTQYNSSYTVNEDKCRSYFEVLNNQEVGR
jgi:hypothetical protein